MIWLISPGHGGIASIHYLTPGKRSPQIPPGIFEGVFNRKIADSLWYLHPNLMDVIVDINPGPINIPLDNRVAWINKIYRKERGNCALISIHANAAPVKGWSGANGFTVFHSWRASENSKRLAALAEKHLRKASTGINSRGIKKVNHKITTKTNCPAILIECGFMTNKKEAIKLAEYETQVRIAAAISCAMCDYS